jgi:hypothetical protein
VPQDRHGFQSKVLSQALQIHDFRFYTDIFRADITRGSTPASLVVVDEAERIGQVIHLGEKIVVVEIRPSMQEDDRLSLADLAIIQISTFNRDHTFTYRRLV